MYEKELLLLLSSHLSEDELQVICNPEDPVFITDVMIPPLLIDPHTDGPTCYTTGLWLSHTGIGVDPKINPLTLCVI